MLLIEGHVYKVQMTAIIHSIKSKTERENESNSIQFLSKKMSNVSN